MLWRGVMVAQMVYTESCAGRTPADMWHCQTCGCTSNMHLPTPERGHAADAESPSVGSEFTAHMPRVKAVEGFCAATTGTQGLCKATAAPVLSDMGQLPG